MGKQRNEQLEAIRSLVADKRYKEAGERVLRMLRISPDEVGSLRGQQRRHAQRAALYFASAGDLALAIRMLTALGDNETVAKLQARSRAASPGSLTAPR